MVNIDECKTIEDLKEIEKFLLDKYGDEFSIDLNNLSEDDIEFLKEALPDKLVKMIVRHVWCAHHGVIYAGPPSGAQNAINMHIRSVPGFHSIRQYDD